MILKGKKVILRPIKLSDAERFVKWFNDPEVNKFLVIRELTLINERKYIKRRLASKTADTFHFCIDTKDGVHIGATSIEGVNKETKMPLLALLLAIKIIGVTVMAQM